MIFELEDIGRFVAKANKRNRRIIARWKEGFFEVSYPAQISISMLKEELSKMSVNLLSLKKEVEKKKSLFILDIGDVFNTLTFTVKIQRTTLSKNFYSFKDKTLTLSFTENDDISSKGVQDTIKHVVEEVCRHEAKWFLSMKLKDLATLHQFTYNSLKINKSRGRWGSCSSSGNINLSLFCMMLPAHLVDLVILHELCHTKEMSHGPAFWKWLDKVTAGTSQQLTNELNAFKLKW